MAAVVSDLRSCPVCGANAIWSPEVLLIIVFAPMLPKPYPLIASEGYEYCVGNCDATLQMVRRAVDAHPTTRMAGQWTKAIIVHVDGTGTGVEWRGRREAVGLA